VYINNVLSDENVSVDRHYVLRKVDVIGRVTRVDWRLISQGELRVGGVIGRMTREDWRLNSQGELRVGASSDELEVVERFLGRHCLLSDLCFCGLAAEVTVIDYEASGE